MATLGTIHLMFACITVSSKWIWIYDRVNYCKNEV